jgi:hypothetical protein
VVGSVGSVGGSGGGCAEHADGSALRVESSVLRVDGGELRAAGAACLDAARAFDRVAAAVVSTGTAGPPGGSGPAGQPSSRPGPRGVPGLSANGAGSSGTTAVPATRAALDEAIKVWHRACTLLGDLFGDLGERLEGVDVALGEVDQALAGSVRRVGG